MSALAQKPCFAAVGKLLILRGEFGRVLPTEKHVFLSRERYSKTKGYKEAGE